MIVSMQGSWTLTVTKKRAAFNQQFVVSGAASGNGIYPGIVGTSVNVTGAQWSIAIQNNPGTGFRLSKTLIKTPQKVAGNYEFEIWSEDYLDNDYNDLILTCSTPVNINDFIIYGNVLLYDDSCIFNPCRRGPFVIETELALNEALRNLRLRKIIEKLYPERIPRIISDPNPPDSAPFRPLVFDLYNEVIQSKTALVYKRTEKAKEKPTQKSRKDELPFDLSINSNTFQKSYQQKGIVSEIHDLFDKKDFAKIIDGLHKICHKVPAPNITLTFEEYDRSDAELLGNPYTGDGQRQLCGDTITDQFGNYIFRFSFGMVYPNIEDSTDVVTGENINVVICPDIIVKVTGYSPSEVFYESAPYFNIPNLKCINLCIPKSKVTITSTCFNGSLIGSLGNIFIGGNQNSTASSTDAALVRDGYSNYLDAEGKISVGNQLSGFSAECAAWAGVIDMKGCMYDTSIPADQNKIKWYIIRIKREDSNRWEFISQNYKHPKYSKRNLPNYTGDDVGPFLQDLKVDGGDKVTVNAYINIQREMHVDGVDWEQSNSDRYMKLNTALYDLIAGVRTPGTFYVRVDCFDDAGMAVPGATDMIALYIHNLPLSFSLTQPILTDPLIAHTDCGLYRLTDEQMNTPLEISFKAKDSYGFIDSYNLAMGRCPSPMIALQVNQPLDHDYPYSNLSILSLGDASGNIHPLCEGYKGTEEDFSDSNMITFNIQPATSEGAWIKAGEYFTVLSFHLTAQKRVTNGYNDGLSDIYNAYGSIYMERII